MDFESMQDEAAAFGVFFDESIGQSLSSLSSRHSLPLSQVFNEYVAFCETNSIGKIDDDELDHFERLVAKLKVPVKKTVVHEPCGSVEPTNGFDVLSMYGVTDKDVISKNDTRSEISLSQQSESSDDIVLSGTISKDGLKVVASSTKSTSLSDSDFKSAGSAFKEFDWKYYDQSNVVSQYKLMYQKLSDIASILSDAIDIYGDRVNSDLDRDEPLASVTQVALNDVTVCGMIQCDSKAEKFSSHAVCLQGSQSGSNGRSCQVNLTEFNNYSLFTGQCVAMSGTNPTGDVFIPSCILEPKVVPPVQLVPNESSGSLRLLVASGPFFDQNTLLFQCLDDFVLQIESHRPDFVILTGPFFPHRKNLSKYSFDDLASEIVNNIGGYLKQNNIDTKILVQSSCLDGHSTGVYPCPPYKINMKTSENIMFLPDPFTIDIGGLILSSTSVDSLMHLSKSEISRFEAPPTVDRMQRLIGHLLAQKSFYPVVPPHEDVNIDFVQFEKHCSLPTTPHVLILPSDLRYFSKMVHGVHCINPGRIVKRSFARMCFDFEKCENNVQVVRF